MDASTADNTALPTPPMGGISAPTGSVPAQPGSVAMGAPQNASQAPAGMSPLMWTQVAAQPAFQRLNRQQRDEVRNNYFNKVVVPKLGQQAASQYRQEFMRKSQKDVDSYKTPEQQGESIGKQLKDVFAGQAQQFGQGVMNSTLTGGAIGSAMRGMGAPVQERAPANTGEKIANLAGQTVGMGAEALATMGDSIAAKAMQALPEVTTVANPVVKKAASWVAKHFPSIVAKSSTLKTVVSAGADSAKFATNVGSQAAAMSIAQQYSQNGKIDTGALKTDIVDSILLGAGIHAGLKLGGISRGLTPSSIAKNVLTNEGKAPLGPVGDGQLMTENPQNLGARDYVGLADYDKEARDKIAQATRARIGTAQEGLAPNSPQSSSNFIDAVNQDIEQRANLQRAKAIDSATKANTAQNAIGQPAEAHDIGKVVQPAVISTVRNTIKRAGELTQPLRDQANAELAAKQAQGLRPNSVAEARKLSEQVRMAPVDTEEKAKLGKLLSQMTKTDAYIDPITGKVTPPHTPTWEELDSLRRSTLELAGKSEGAFQKNLRDIASGINEAQNKFSPKHAQLASDYAKAIESNNALTQGDVGKATRAILAHTDYPRKSGIDANGDITLDYTAQNAQEALPQYMRQGKEGADALVNGTGRQTAATVVTADVARKVQNMSSAQIDSMLSKEKEGAFLRQFPEVHQKVVAYRDALAQHEQTAKDASKEISRLEKQKLPVNPEIQRKAFFDKMQSGDLKTMNEWADSVRRSNPKQAPQIMRDAVASYFAERLKLLDTKMSSDTLNARQDALTIEDIADMWGKRKQQLVGAHILTQKHADSIGQIIDNLDTYRRSIESSKALRNDNTALETSHHIAQSAVMDVFGRHYIPLVNMAFKSIGLQGAAQKIIIKALVDPIESNRLANYGNFFKTMQADPQIKAALRRLYANQQTSGDRQQGQDQ